MAAAKVLSRAGSGAQGLAPGEDKGIRSYYLSKIDELELVVRERTQNLARLKAQRNEWNAKGEWQAGAVETTDEGEGEVE